MNAKDATRKLYRIIAKGAPPIRMRLWDGEEIGPSDASVTLVLHHPGSLRALLLPPSDLTAGEAYVYDDVDIEGDIVAALRVAAPLQESGMLHKLRAMSLLARLPGHHRRLDARRPVFGGRLHSVRRDRDAVSHHYDTGNDFFSLFLDPDMVYSCAYWLRDDDTLTDAQRRKLDVVCRKLQLRPGMRLLDVGCGWGALAIHAAARYGVTVTGVTLSEDQADLGRKRVAEAGLTDRITILQRDYREVRGTFDAISSIGMFEHVGAGELGVYFSHLRGLLAPRGIFLNHGITDRSRQGGRKRPSFVNTYVFPDGELVPIETVAEQAERAGFEVRDAESLRMSYTRTLQQWVANLESHRKEAVAQAGEMTYRIWRLYMAGSALAFELGAISIYQLVLTPPDRTWTYGRRWMLADDDR